MLTRDLSRYRDAMLPMVQQTLMTCPPSMADDSLWLAGVASEMLIHASDAKKIYPLSLALEQLGLRESHMLVDPAGHRRPIYWLLATHLSLYAWSQQQAGQVDLPASMTQAMERLQTQVMTLDQEDGHAIDLQLWRLLCLADYARIVGAKDQLEAIALRVRQLIQTPGRDGALHRHDPDDSLDAWTYRELVGLHALFALARLMGDGEFLQRCQAIVRHHVENTQPDNTTNQPWALAAFMVLGDDPTFADQQLHDATTQGSLQGRKDLGLVACLLLADAMAQTAEA